ARVHDLRSLLVRPTGRRARRPTPAGARHPPTTDERPPGPAPAAASTTSATGALTHLSPDHAPRTTAGLSSVRDQASARPSILVFSADTETSASGRWAPRRRTS